MEIYAYIAEIKIKTKDHLHLTQADNNSINMILDTIGSAKNKAAEQIILYKTKYAQVVGM